MSDLESVKNIYVYKSLSLVVGFGTTFFVVPLLASDTAAYGIYALIMSLVFLLTYGDLGFLSAAQKYCAEEVGRSRLDIEVAYVGFIVAFLLLLAGGFCALMLVLYANPTFFLPDLDEDHAHLASNLFFILATLMPIQVVLQRTSILILASRLKEYLAIRIDIIANLLKVLCAPIFMTESGFLLDDYLFFSIFLSIIAAIGAFLIVARQTDFLLNRLTSEIYFSRAVYDKFKGLAYSSLALTVLFVGYYELDLLIAAQFFSIYEIAAYSLAFVLMNFVRNLGGIIYAPLMAYLNRHWGRGEHELVYQKFRLFVLATVPLFIAVSTVLIIGADNLIYQWMGDNLPLTILLFKILLFGSFFSGLVNAVPLLATTMERKHVLYLSGLVPFLSFYTVFIVFSLLLPDSGVERLAYAKALAGLLAALFSAKFLYVTSVLTTKLLMKVGVIGVLIFVFIFYVETYFDLDGELLPASLEGLLVTVIIFGFSIIVLSIFIGLFFHEIRLAMKSVIRREG